MGTKRIKTLTFFLFIFILCFLFFSLSIQASSRGITVISDLSHQSGKLGPYRALIIGINDYEDPKIPELATAVDDARTLAELLKERYGFKVTLLLNRKATKGAIYRALRDLASSTKPDDSVLIYYAGHGDLDRTYNDGWWIPADAKGGDPVTYLDNVIVQKSMRSMEARHVLLISDSCYSGTMFGQARAMPPVIGKKYYLNLYNEKSRWGMTSGNKTPVSDTGSGGHSVFAYQLLKELKKNEKPYLSTQELYTRIAPIVGNNSEQTPICRPIRNTGDQGGEFVFVASSGVKTAKVNTDLDTERKRIEAEKKTLGEKIKTEKLPKQQLAYISQTPTPVQAENRLTLAFFPSKLASADAMHVINGFKAVISDTELFYLKLSYYNLGHFLIKGVLSSTTVIDKNTMPPEVIKDFWVRKSFFSQEEPNLELICKLGTNLQVDYIILYNSDTNYGGGHTCDLKVFLINVKTKKIYSGFAGAVHKPSGGKGPWEETKILTRKVFTIFAKSESKQ